MPTEDRRIIFTADEVYKAIFTFCTQKQIAKPPGGHLLEIKQDEKDEAQVFFTIEDAVSKELNTVEYSRDFLAAALLLFCRGLGIPVAKSGKKSVLVREGQVMLRIMIS